MKKVLVCLLVVAMILSLFACGAGTTSEPEHAVSSALPTEEPTPTPEPTVSPTPTPEPTAAPTPEPEVVKIGEVVSTDMVEFVLDECKFAEKIGLKSDNWFQPASGTGGMVPGDGEVFIYFSFHTKNISKDDLSGYDVCRVKVDYNNGFIYDDTSCSDGNTGWSDTPGLSKSVGLASMIPLAEQRYMGYTKCAATVREDRSVPLYVIFTMPSSQGNVEFKYQMKIADDLTNESAYDAVLSLGQVKDNLAFIVRNVDGAIGENFDQGFIDKMTNVALSIKVEDLPSSLSDTISTVPQIQEKVLSVAGYLHPVNDSNVGTIKSTCQDAIALIDSLINGELSGI